MLGDERVGQSELRGQVQQRRRHFTAARASLAQHGEPFFIGVYKRQIVSTFGREAGQFAEGDPMLQCITQVCALEGGGLAGKARAPAQVERTLPPKSEIGLEGGDHRQFKIVDGRFQPELHRSGIGRYQLHQPAVGPRRRAGRRVDRQPERRADASLCHERRERVERVGPAPRRAFEMTGDRDGAIPDPVGADVPGIDPGVCGSIDQIGDIKRDIQPISALGRAQHHLYGFPLVAGETHARHRVECPGGNGLIITENLVQGGFDPYGRIPSGGHVAFQRTGLAVQSVRGAGPGFHIPRGCLPDAELGVQGPMRGFQALADVQHRAAGLEQRKQIIRALRGSGPVIRTPHHGVRIQFELLRLEFPNTAVRSQNGCLDDQRRQFLGPGEMQNEASGLVIHLGGEFGGRKIDMGKPADQVDAVGRLPGAFRLEQAGHVPGLDRAVVVAGHRLDQEGMEVFGVKYRIHGLARLRVGDGDPVPRCGIIAGDFDGLDALQGGHINAIRGVQGPAGGQSRTYPGRDPLILVPCVLDRPAHAQRGLVRDGLDQAGTLQAGDIGAVAIVGIAEDRAAGDVVQDLEFDVQPPVWDVKAANPESFLE